MPGVTMLTSFSTKHHRHRGKPAKSRTPICFFSLIQGLGPPGLLYGSGLDMRFQLAWP